MPQPNLMPRRRGKLSWWLSLAGLVAGGGVGLVLMQGDQHGLAWGRSTARAADVGAVTFHEDQLPATAAGPVSTRQGDHPEDLLVQVFDLLDRHELDDALLVSRRLVQTHPDFTLAQFVHAQLEALRAPVPVGDWPVPLGDWPAPMREGHVPAGGDASMRSVQDLLDEARLRLAAHRSPPPTDSVPSALIEVSPRTRHVLAIDTGESRLHVFENGDQGLRRVDDMYVTIGRRGVGKSEEGDQKTPIGVYHTGMLRSYQPADPRLGTHGYTLNFPNALDRVSGRGGTAILLHGVPPDTYSRAPQASDGCLSLSNADLQRLVARGIAPDTPVVIAHRLDWTAPASIARPAPMDAAWRHRLATSGTPNRRIEDINMLAWQDQGVVVVSFSAFDGARRQKLRQYWGERDGAWQVLAEGEVR